MYIRICMWARSHEWIAIHTHSELMWPYVKIPDLSHILHIVENKVRKTWISLGWQLRILANKKTYFTVPI